MIFLKQSTSSTISFGPAVANTDGVTLVTTLVGTGSNQFENTSTGIQLSKNGAAMAVRHATAGASTYLAYGMYAVILDTTDTNTLGILRVSFSSATTVCPIWIDCMIMPANMYNSMFNTGGSIPDAVAGASAGLLISGSNSGTTTLGALTVTGTTTHTGTTVYTGNVSYADGLTVSAPSTGNRAGITVTGNGTGAGVSITGGNGATGNGMDLIAASTNGHGFTLLGNGTGSGLKASSVSGDAILTSVSTSGHGMTLAGTGTTKHGLNATGGATSSQGINAAGGGSGAGILGTGGVTGHGLWGVGGATSGNGLTAAATTSGIGISAVGVGTTKAGISTSGGSTTSAGLSIVGGGTSGDGISVTTTSGHGINLAPVGTNMHGILTTGGNGGTSDGLKAVAGTGGVPIRGNITGNITGTLDTVTTATNVTTVNGLAANVVTATSINADAITAAKIANAAIDQATFASDVPSLAMRTGTAQAGAATTITLDSGASASNNFYNNTLIFITGGTGIGQSRFITAYVGATKVATVATWVTNPDNTSTFAILPFDAVAGATAPTVAQIATGVWQDTTAGDFTVSASVGKSVMNGVALGTGLTVNALTTNNDKTGYALTSAYDPAKTAAQAGDAMALTSGERNSTADALLDRTNAIETSITPRGALRLATAMAAGKTNGMDVAGTAHIRDVADGKNRVTATTDGAGNRTATSIDTT